MNETEKIDPNALKIRQTNFFLAVWPRVVYWALQRRWGDGDQLLLLARIDRNELFSNMTIPFEPVALLCLKAVEKHGDEVILEVGKAANANCLGTHGIILQAAPNLQTLFKTIRDAQAAFAPNGKIEFKRSASAFVFDFTLPFVTFDLAKMFLYVIVQVVSDLVARHPGCNKVQYAVTSGPTGNKFCGHPGVDYGDYVVKPNLFNGTVGLRVTFPADVAYIQNVFFPNPDQFAEMLRLYTLIKPGLRGSVAAHRLVDQINNLILLHRTSLDKGFVVERLGYSHRTFDRMLSQENTNWRTAKAHALLRLMQVLAAEGISEEQAFKQIGFANRKGLIQALSHAK